MGLLVRTRVGPSPIHGRGLFLLDDVSALSPIWEWDPDFDRLLSRGFMSGSSSGSSPWRTRLDVEFARHHGFELPCGCWCLPSDDARYMNHSSHPTTISDDYVGRYLEPVSRPHEWCDHSWTNDRGVLVRGAKILIDVAARDLPAGTELTCDYSKFDRSYSRREMR